jgi:phosphate transport system substrate-binding protein
MEDQIKISILVLIILISGCKGINRDPYTDTPTTGIISICVDETFKPIAQAELMVFSSFYPYAKITPRYVPENKAFDLLLTDSVRLIIASRPLQQKEKDVFIQKKLFPREIEIAKDAIALIVNPANNDTLLSNTDLFKVLTGDISEWKQLNPLSELKNIEVVFDNKNSGTVRYVIDSLCKGAILSKHLYALDSNLDVVNYVSHHINAMGFIGVSWISDQDDTTQMSFLRKIRVVALSKEERATPENSYQPYQAYIYNGSYPLTRSIFAINTEPRNGLATGFMTFVASDKGQRIILKAGILPAIAPVRLIKVEDEW